MIQRADVINSLIEKYNYSNYLEIGVQAGHTFDKIRIKTKHSVDPAASVSVDYPIDSDTFFKEYCNQKYDIIFIDGLHHCDQVLRDISNSINFLSKDGTIVIDDTLPKNEEMQKVPRDTTPNIGNGPGKPWTGDVWKAVVKYSLNTNIILETIDVQYGISIIRLKDNKLIWNDKPLICNSEYSDFVKNYKEWLRVKD